MFFTHTIPNKALLRSLICVCMLMAFRHVNAQFTYLGMDVGYERMGLEGAGQSSMNQGVLVLQAMSRPFRNIGVGVSYSIPFVAKHNLNRKGQTLERTVSVEASFTNPTSAVIWSSRKSSVFSSGYSQAHSYHFSLTYGSPRTICPIRSL